MEQRTRARELRNQATPAERRLWHYLSARRLAGFRFNRQVLVGPFICDFVCRELRLVIEVDGGQHSWQTAEDQARTAFLEAQGYQVIRFWNNDVMERVEWVVDRITDVVANLPSPDPSRKREGRS